MGEKIGWKFERSASGDVEGLNDGGVETFKDDHLLSLAKESAQNSLDARKDKSQPVVLEFNTFEINQKDFPCIDDYREIIDLQIKYWQKSLHDKSPEQFFIDAKKTLDSKKILCLRISDFNTTGLDGSRDGMNNDRSSWWKLVRSKGVTDNDSLAGGSFGLGKFASFACSKLRTAFYSTKDLSGLESHQGVSILASYDTKEGERTRGKGYFCNLQDFSCLEGPLNLDKNFSRDVPGTDIYVMGFIDSEKELEDKLFSSILRSFLLAIYKGDLIFHLNGKTLEKKNLKDIIDKYRDEIYRPFISKETIQYYDILEGNLDFEEFHCSMIEKDDTSLKIAVSPGLSKRIGMFRNNGMKIFDKRNIGSYGDFVGVLTLKGDNVNAYFRKLENPEHNDWRHERAGDQEKSREAKAKINKLFNFIKNKLKDLENKTMPESENMEGINSLSDEEFEEEGETPLDGLDFKPLNVRKTKPKRKKINKIKISTGDGGGGNGGNGNNGGGGGGGGPDKGDLGESGPGDNDNNNATIEVFPEKIKVFQDKDGEYNLIFSIPEESESLSCKILIGGEEFSETVEIEKANIINKNKENKLEVSENKIELGFVAKNSSNHLKFKLKEDEKWTLEVSFFI